MPTVVLGRQYPVPAGPDSEPPGVTTHFWAPASMRGQLGGKPWNQPFNKLLQVISVYTKVGEITVFTGRHFYKLQSIKNQF